MGKREAPRAAKPSASQAEGSPGARLSRGEGLAPLLTWLKHIFRGRRAILPVALAVLALSGTLLAVYLNTPPAQAERSAADPPPTTRPGAASQTTTPGQPAVTTTPAEDATEPPPLVRKENFYTFLLLGTHDDYNTDSIMLASMDLSGQRPQVDIISIPRDSQIDTSWSLKKINSVYGVNKGGEAGAEAACEWVARITGVPVDFYAVVNIASFTKLVDLVKGVPFYIPYDMVHTKPDKDPDQAYYIDMPKGQYTLTSEQALAVVRYRGTGRSDWGRMDIQKDFLIALMQRVKSQFSIDKIPGLIDIAVSSIKTNMPAKDMLWFYTNGVSKMNLGEDITLHSLPDLGPGKYKGQDYVFLDGPGIAALVNETVNPYTTDIDADMLSIIRLED